MRTRQSTTCNLVAWCSVDPRICRLPSVGQIELNPCVVSRVVSLCGSVILINPCVVLYPGIPGSRHSVGAGLWRGVAERDCFEQVHDKLRSHNERNGACA